ncbi:MAG: hypothetical protein H8E55_61200, partial [Pelagibacterales bacterium]|nr:hypothetical protein [Pelagibacterales bacterium]
MKTKPITLIVLLLFCLSGSVFAGESDQALEVILGEGWFDKPTSLGVPMGVLFMLAMLGMMFNNNNSNAETQSEDQIKKELGEHISDSNNNIYYKNSIHYEEAKNVLDLIRKYKFSGADIQLNRLNDNYILKIIPKNLKQHMESINVPTEKKSFENLLHDLSVYCFDIRKTDIHFCDVNFTTKHIFESSEKITKVSDNSYIVT